MCRQGPQRAGEPALADHGDMTRQREAGIGEHDVGVARRQPPGHCDRRIAGDRDPGVGRRQRIQFKRGDTTASLKEYAAASAVDRRPQFTFTQMRQGVGQGLADGDRGHRDAGGQRDPMRQSEGGADAGEASRSDGHRDQIESGRVQTCLVQHGARHDRQQPGMAADRRFAPRRDRLLVHDDSGRALRQGGIEGQYAHPVTELGSTPWSVAAPPRPPPLRRRGGSVHPVKATAFYRKTHAWSQPSRGERGNSPAGSP